MRFENPRSRAMTLSSRFSTANRGMIPTMERTLSGVCIPSMWSWS